MSLASCATGSPGPAEITSSVAGRAMDEKADGGSGDITGMSNASTASGRSGRR
jgi:hypothetical protein